MPRLPAAKLTKRLIDATPLPETGEAFVWDSELRGFGLRLYATGRRLFVLQYQTPETNTTRRLALGAFPAITVEQARELVKKHQLALANGRDPKGNDLDDAQRAALSTVFPQYLASRVQLAERTRTEYARVWEKILAPTFGALPVSRVDEASVARWHQGSTATPISANRALVLLSAFFVWAERRGFRVRHSNPCAEVEHYPETKRGRSLTREEYRQLGAAFQRAATVGIRNAPKLRKDKASEATRRHRTKSADLPHITSPAIVAALRLLTLSGWREQEALTLRWDAVDLERGVATLTDTKTGRSERSLGAPALALLRAQPRAKDAVYVFPGTRSGLPRKDGTRPIEPLKDVKYSWQSIKYAAELETTAPFRLHDLRHSFTTVARDLGYGDHVIARLVGHTLTGTTSRYGEVRDATVRQAANAIAQEIDGYLNGNDAKVLPFKALAGPG